MQIHSNSKTTPFVRSEFKRRTCCLRKHALQYGVSPTTVYKWSHREDVHDRSSRPKNVRRALEPDCECVALVLRRQGFTLDECLEALQPLFPSVRRSALHRFYVKHGLGNLRSKVKEAPKKFKKYKPGYVHIDTFNMPKLGGKKRYGFIAIDRATRILFVGVYNRRTKVSAQDFVLKAIAFFPFKVYCILTDNGAEYTNHHYKGGTAKKVHHFDVACQQHGIQHRLTKIRTPKTNGMAERMVQMSKQKALRPVHYATHEEMEMGFITWSHRYNCFRKHGSLGRRPPLEEARKWYKEEPELFTRNPDTLLEVFTTYRDCTPST